MLALEKLTHELAKLPGIGHKTALRLALHILRQPSEYPQALLNALQDVIKTVQFCNECFHFSDKDICKICSDQKRDIQTICVVEDSCDLLAIEQTRSFRGKYHVLQGSLSPLDGIGPDQLKISELMNRLRAQSVSELILATNPNVNGDTTALYISKLVKSTGVRLTRLASGIPMGSQIEYIDHMTLSRAMESRQLF